MVKNRIPRDANRVPLMGALSSTGDGNIYPLEINPGTGGLVVDVSISAPGLPSAVVNGQQVATSAAIALPTSTLSQGVILESLSTNTASIFIGGPGVTESTGTELQPGASTSVAVNNLNSIYIICSTLNQTITWIGS